MALQEALESIGSQMETFLSQKSDQEILDLCHSSKVRSMVKNAAKKVARKRNLL